MADTWTPIPIEAKWFANLHETALTRAQAAMENSFINEAGGHSRFPGLAEFCDIEDSGRVYLNEWRKDLVAATSKGFFYRVDDDGNVENKTGVPLSGGHRTIFAQTDTDLLMASGGPIIAFDGMPTRVLSEDAPNSNFVAVVDSFVLAIEHDSDRFSHSQAGAYDQWDPLDTFSANGNPDNINALLVTPFREVILTGEKSTEQFERIATGNAPFFRRWSVGEGFIAPHTVMAADNGVWGLNKNFEFIRFSGQASEPKSTDLNRLLAGWDKPGDPIPVDLTDAWVGGYPDQPLNILGQNFILLQLPKATNPYGTTGLTLIYDFRQQRWFTLYGWDAAKGLPTRWPGWSYWPVRGKYYVGGEGKIYKMTQAAFENAGVTQRFYGRTAHLSELGETRIDNIRVRLRRGTGSYTTEPLFSFRAKRDDKTLTRWIRRGLGKSGQRDMVLYFGGLGCATTWQFEWAVTDDTPVEMVKLEAVVTPLGR